MALLDWLQSFRGAFAHPARAMLTLVGLMIGSGSIVLLACLLASAETALLAADQNATDNDLVEVRGDDVPVDQKEKTRRELSRGDEAVLRETGQALGGAMVSAEGRRQGVAYVREHRKNVGLVSGMPSTAELYRLHPAHGRFLTEEDLESRRRVVVIGDEVFRDLYDGKWDGTEKRITVDAATFVVVGVLEHKAYMGSTTGTWIWDRKVVLPQTTYDAMFAPTHEVARLFVRRPKAAGALPMAALRGLVRASILRRHFGVENFKVLKPDGDKQEKLIIDIIEGLLLGTGLLAMLASGINIMNVMLVTVTERTKEIGIRIAMGARRSTILGQFVVESAVLALFGGLLGVLGGLGVAWLGSLALKSVFPAWPFLVAPWSLGLGLGLAIVTGVVFGLFPAWRASRLDPIAALRFD